jgi:3-phosphoshikimate 1-carboxyvinyltransferase
MLGPGGGAREDMPAATQVRPLTGTIRVPGDKSISHRALVLGALAPARSTVTGVNLGTDVLATIAMLRRLGVAITVDHDKHLVEVDGCGWAGLTEPDDVLDAGNSGTAIRLMAGVCAGVDCASVLTGDHSVRRRPMLRVVAPLRRMGARIDGRRGGDRAPLLVRGGRLSGINFESPVASAQVKTAVLLAGLRADGATTVMEPAPSRDHTERMLAARGVRVMRSGRDISVAGGAELRALDQSIPGDISAAMFFIVAALLIPESRLTITGVGLNPTRTAALDVLTAMGGRIETIIAGEVGGEPVGDISVEASELHGVEVDPKAVPALIDEVPALAVAAVRAEGTTVLTGADELRVKESDRIGALARGLSILGADVREITDGLIISGPSTLSGGHVDSHNDHRIAMALAVAGLFTAEPVRIIGWKSVASSFPEFLDVLAEARA